MSEYIVKVNNKSLSGMENTLVNVDVREKIVRCKDCKHLLKNGYVLDEFFNASEDTACNLFSSIDFDYGYESFWYVKPDDFCKWGEAK